MSPSSNIDADSFLETRREWCEVCWKYASTHGQPVEKWCYDCTHHTSCLSTEALYAHVNDALTTLSGSTAFHDSGLGMIVVQGIYALECAALREVK